MDLNFQIAQYLKESNKEFHLSHVLLKKLVSLIDLTSLNSNDTENSIKELCLKANTPLGKVAAVCVYPKFVPFVAKQLKDQKIAIASVANFPSGEELLEEVIEEINFALDHGANEIDIVFPYSLYLKGETLPTLDFIQTCKKACDKALLKVILEISEFEKLEQISILCNELIAAGADFLKTSTGKSKHGATLEAASVMLLAIKHQREKNIGFKAAGGIKDIKEAFSYIELAQKIMGEDWVTPSHFRIGSSQVLDKILTLKLS